MNLSERYARAARLTAPKLAARTPGLTIDGYWLDANRYFFLQERFDDGVIAEPAVVDAASGKITVVMGIDTFAGLLKVKRDALASAVIDMPAPDRLAVSVAGRDCVIDTAKEAVITDRPALEVPALYAPDGRYAVIVKSDDLWLKDLDNGSERALTTDGTAHNSYGRQPDSCLNAVSYRKKPQPMGLWSADSQWFITHRIDERDLHDLALVENVPAGGGRPVLHTYKYPMPGDAVPIATYVAIHVASGRVLPFTDFPSRVWAFSPFLFRRIWFDGPGRAWMLRLDRYHRQLDLIRLDLETGRAAVVVSEAAEKGYVDLNANGANAPNIRTLRTSNEVIWYSERDGWAHLYLYDAATGALKNRITEGPWVVRDIVHVDEVARRILFLAGGRHTDVDPTWRTLCAVNFDGSEFAELRRHDGDLYIPTTEPTGADQTRPHRPAGARPGLSPDGRFALVRATNTTEGNHTDIVDLAAGTPVPVIAHSVVPGAGAARHFTALAADGVTRLDGVMFLPSDFDETKKYPLIDYIYPGPQIVHKPQAYMMMRSALAMALSELGFVTIMIDTRGVPGRSREFHQSGYGALLEPQLADHAAVARQLCARHDFLDAARVGMIGQSGGGVATGRGMLEYGDVFKVGVAVCGNHDSTYYSASWSDRYRGPGKAQDWAAEANTAIAHKLQGKLLLIHGDMDENVHVAQTLALADALIRANKDFDMLIVPGAGHDVLMSSGYAHRRMWDYFVTHLLGETPPRDVALTFAPAELARYALNAKREGR